MSLGVRIGAIDWVVATPWVGCVPWGGSRRTIQGCPTSALGSVITDARVPRVVWRSFQDGTQLGKANPRPFHGPGKFGPCSTWRGGGPIAKLGCGSGVDRKVGAGFAQWPCLDEASGLGCDRWTNGPSASLVEWEVCIVGGQVATIVCWGPRTQYQGSAGGSGWRRSCVSIPRQNLACFGQGGEQCRQACEQRWQYWEPR